jgi:hypothetical protein
MANNRHSQIRVMTRSGVCLRGRRCSNCGLPAAARFGRGSLWGSRKLIVASPLRVHRGGVWGARTGVAYLIALQLRGECEKSLLPQL